MLVHCAEFIEKRGIVDGIYRLSGRFLVSFYHTNDVVSGLTFLIFILLVRILVRLHIFFYSKLIT